MPDYPKCLSKVDVPATCISEHARRHATLEDLTRLVELLNKARKCMGLRES